MDGVQFYIGRQSNITKLSDANVSKYVRKSLFFYTVEQKIFNKRFSTVTYSYIRYDKYACLWHKVTGIKNFSQNAVKK